VADLEAFVCSSESGMELRKMNAESFSTFNEGTKAKFQIPHLQNGADFKAK
jgi:hypothetical protein